MSKLRIGFVGVGGMGQCAHLQNYAVLRDCEVVALAELRTDLGRRVAQRYGVPRTYANHTEMLANEQLDGIVASQPFNRHGVLLPDLFQAGVPVFTEKPLTCSIEAGEKILQALRSSSARHYLGYHKRSDPASVYAVEEIRRLKETGELGPMRYVRICMPAGDWVANGFAALLQSDEPLPPMEWDPLPSDMDADTQQAYSAFVNYYIHQVNYMRYLFGEPYAFSYADPAGRILAVHSESGVPGVIEMSPYETTVDWQEEALVAFHHGFVKVRLPAPLAHNRPGAVTVYRDPGDGATPTETRPQLPWVHAMRQQAQFFLDAIHGKRTPLCEAPEALEDLKIARDYIQAMRGG